MAVDVDNRGVIDVGDCTIKTLKNSCTVSLTLQFATEEDARRYHSMLCASIDVQCLHIHFAPMQLTVVEIGRIQ